MPFSNRVRICICVKVLDYMIPCFPLVFIVCENRQYLFSMLSTHCQCSLLLNGHFLSYELPKYLKYVWSSKKCSVEDYNRGVPFCEYCVNAILFGHRVPSFYPCTDCEWTLV